MTRRAGPYGGETAEKARRGENAGFEAAATKILSILGKKNSAADVFLLPGAEMRRLKSRFRGKSTQKEVDVLAFPEPERFPHPEKRRKFLGEVYLNLGIARKDPRRASRLLIHGLLHLLGFSHKGKHDTLKMEKLERELVDKLYRKRNSKT